MEKCVKKQNFLLLTNAKWEYDTHYTEQLYHALEVMIMLYSHHIDSIFSRTDIIQSKALVLIKM